MLYEDIVMQIPYIFTSAYDTIEKYCLFEASKILEVTEGH